MAEKEKAAPAPQVEAEIEYVVLHNAVAGKVRDYVQGEIVKAEQLIGDIAFYLGLNAVIEHPAK